MILPLRSSFILDNLPPPPKTPSKSMFRHCNIDYQEYVGLLGRERNDKIMMSTMIKFVPDIYESVASMFGLRLERWSLEHGSKLGWSVRGREMGTRCLFDYVIANHDRSVANQFWMYSNSTMAVVERDEYMRSVEDKDGHYDWKSREKIAEGSYGKVAKESERVLVYLDQNSQIFDFHNVQHDMKEKEMRNLNLHLLRMSSSCKFYEQPVRRLDSLVDAMVLKDRLKTTFQNLNRHLEPLLEEYGYVMDDLTSALPLLDAIQERAEIALQVVKACVDKYGYDFVFCED